MAEGKTLLEWQANEYFVRKRGAKWFVVFALIVLALLALAIWQRAWTFLALIVVSAVALVVYVRSTPNKVTYTITASGIKAGEKFYPYEELKAFGVIEDDKQFYLRVVPKKRLGSAILLHFEKKDGEKIVDTLGAKLQMERMSLDPLDKMLAKLKI